MKSIGQIRRYLIEHFSFFSILTGFSVASLASLAFTPVGAVFTVLSLFTWVAVFLASFMLCLMLPRRLTPLPAIAGCFLFFQFSMGIYQNSVWFLTGCVLLLGLLLWYGLEQMPELPPVRLPFAKGILISSVTLCGILAALLIGIVGVFRYLCYWSPCFDFGIFCQMFESMRTTLLPNTTCERYKLLSHFAVHISPIYYLLLPFYALFPYPQTLAISQGIVLASAVIPLALLCRLKGLSRKQTVFLAVCLAFFPALHGGTYYDIHENCFLTPLLLWFFYFMEKHSKLGMLLSALLVFAVKEDAAIYIAFIALYLILSRRQPKFGILLLILSIGYLLSAVWLLNRFGDGAMIGRYDNYLEEGQDSLVWVVINAFRNPAYTLSRCFTVEKLEYLLQMLVPLGGGIVLFCTKHPSRLILLGPMVLIPLMSDYVYQHSLYFQYNFGIIAFLFYLAIVNLTECDLKLRRFLALFMVLTSISGFTNLCASRLTITEIYTTYHETYKIYDEVLAKVDRNRSVAANTFLVPHLYDCEELYEVNEASTADQIVLLISDDNSKNLMAAFQNQGYTIVEIREELIVLLEKTASTD